MAGKRSKGKKKESFWSKGDLEALSLLLFAASFFLGVSLYPAKPLSGDWGIWVRQFLLDYLGLLAYLTPVFLALVGVLLLFQKPLGKLLRHSAFATLLGFALLPYCSFKCPQYAGRWGNFAASWLHDKLGNAGLLLPGLVAWVVIDLWMHKPPFWGLTKTLKIGLQSGSRLLASIFSLSASRREYSSLRHAARQMKQQVDELAAQYPDHGQLATLAEELSRIAKKPSAEDEDNLEAYRSTIEEFQQQRAAELLQRLQTEPSPIIAEIEALARLLEKPLGGGNDLMTELESRRKALQLEVASLKKQYLRLQRASSRDAERLKADFRRLAAVEKSLAARRDDWRQLNEDYEEVANRAEAWERWVDWAESQPEEYHAAALQILKQGGLVASPPSVVASDDAPEAAEPKPKPQSAKPKKPAATSRRAVPETTPTGLPPTELLDPPEEQRANESSSRQRRKSGRE